MADNISNAADAIDSRDVIARIEELTDLRDDDAERAERIAELRAEIANATDNDETPPADMVAELADLVAEAPSLDDDDAAELAALESLAEDAEDYAEDWRHGCTLIRDSYFEDYARDLAEDCGMIASDAKWPNNHIDWSAAAEELKQDYTSVDFDGVDYWVR